MKRLAVAHLAFFVLIVAAGPASADESSPGCSLSGVVSGPHQTGLSGAVITIRNTGSGQTFSSISGARGLYRVSGLPSGRYDLRAELDGFEPTVVNAVRLLEGESRGVDFEMPIATIREIVTVVSSTPHDSLEMAETRESSARDPGEALAHTPGITMLRKGGIANDVVLRGLQSKDLNVLVDGQRVYGACPNHMDPSAFHVDFAEVERMEVGKGPFDIRNQGSVGGVINIVTRKPAEGFHAGADLSMGSYGFLNPSATASYGNDRFSALAGYSYRVSAPYTDGSGQRFTEYANFRTSALDSDAYRIGTGWGKLYGRPFSGQRAQLAYSHQKADHVLYPYLQMDAIYDNADRVNFAYQFERLPGLARTVDIQAYYSQVNHWMTDTYRVSSMNAARDYSMGTLARSSVAGGRAEGGFGDLSLGIEAYSRIWNAATQMAGMGYQNQFSIPDVEIRAAGMYADYRRALTDRLRLNVNARFDRVHSAADGSKANTNLYYAYNSTRLTSATDSYPSGSAHLSWAAPGGFEVSAGAGHMVRVPDASERYFGLRRAGSDWVGNPQLKPARNSGLDGRVSFRRNGLLISSGLYFYEIRDFITVIPGKKVNPITGIMNVNARSYANVDACILGQELELVYALSRRLFISGNLSNVLGRHDALLALGLPSGYLVEMPPLSSRAGARYDTGRYWFELEGIAVARQHRVDATLQEAPTPGHGIANLRAGMTLRRLALRIGLSNVFDHRYFEHLSYQRDPFRTGARVFEPGRNLYVNISFRY